MRSRMNKSTFAFFLGNQVEKTAALLKSIIPEHPLMAKCTKESASWKKSEVFQIFNIKR